MKQLWQRVFGGCDHRYTIEVSSVGVRRSLCERCGHISFEIANQVSRPVKAASRTDLPKASGF